MFDISFSELLLIGIVALVVIGPERLPKVARTIGHLLGRAQRYVNDVKSDIQREISAADVSNLKDDLESAANALKSSLDDAGSSLKAPLEEARQSVEEMASSLTDAVNKIEDNVTSLSNPPDTAASASIAQTGPTPESTTDDNSPQTVSAADLDPYTLPLPGIDAPAGNPMPPTNTAAATGTPKAAASASSPTPDTPVRQP